LEENKDMREFQVELRELGKNIEAESVQKKQNVNVIYCNYIGFKTSKKSLVFKTKM
jgi:hypothetical protein